MDKNQVTTAWRRYEDGRSYNNRLVPNQYSVVDTNTEFFIGNQWLHLPETPAMRGMPKPTFNIIKRVTSLFIASLTSSGVTIRFDPLAYYSTGDLADLGVDAATFANAEVSNLLEKFGFEYRVRDALYDGAQTGDYCAHFYFDPDSKPYGGAFGAYRGEIKMELVDGINVMFGNPNCSDVQSQPYILVIGRDTVEHLRWEAERFKANKDIYKSGTANPGDKSMIESEIQPDAEYQWFTGVGGRTEITSDDGNGKALFVYMYTKVSKEVDQLDENGDPVYEDVLDKNGDPVYEKDKDGRQVLDANGAPIPKRKVSKVIQTSVHVTKATRTAVIFEDVDTGMSRYPIAWGNWEKQKNQYHGRALVTGIIPNQITINTMFAACIRYLQLMAFPKTVYNADLIARWDNTVAQAIGVHGLQPGQSIEQVAYNLQPAQMSNQIFTMIDKAMAYTKECLGATDAQLGNVKPDNTSALMVLQTNAEVPLENIRAGLYEWVEDIGAILLDMMGTYYGKRPVVVDKDFQELVIGPSGAPVIDPMTGTMMTQMTTKKTVMEFDFSKFKHLWLNMRVDVGATTYFSEIAMSQTLDNLRRDGTLDVIQYLERIPDKLIPRKDELIRELRARIAQGQQANAAAGAAIPVAGESSSGSNPVQGGPLDLDKVMQSMPESVQSQFDSLPGQARNALVKQANMKI